MQIAITAIFRSVLILLLCSVFSKCTVMLMEDGVADTLRCTLQLQHGHRADMNFLYCTRHRHQSYSANTQSIFWIFRLAYFRECGFEIWNAESYYVNVGERNSKLWGFWELEVVLVQILPWTADSCTPLKGIMSYYGSGWFIFVTQNPDLYWSQSLKGIC